MTDRLDELQRLHDAATKGPWFAHNTDDDHFMNAYAVTTSEREPDLDQFDGFEKGVDKSVVALTLLQAPRVVGHESTRWQEDAELIAAMRNALPALLRVARAAQKVIGGDTFTADDLRTHFPDAYELHAALAELRGTT